MVSWIYRKIGDIKCFLGFCNIIRDPYPINGVWWGFCSRCGRRWEGNYDMMYGCENWKRR